MVPSIVVVDYHKGNLSSVVRGLSRAGARAQASDSPEDIRAADAVVLPGVGSFYDAIAFMQESGEAQAVLDAIDKGTPFLGICLGLQLLFERGDEGVPEDAPAALAEDAMEIEPCSRRGFRGVIQALDAWLGRAFRFVFAFGIDAPQSASCRLGPGASDR